MNRQLLAAFNTWAADIMGQRDLGGKLRDAIKKGESAAAASKAVGPLLAGKGEDATRKGVFDEIDAAGLTAILEDVFAN